MGEWPRVRVGAGLGGDRRVGQPLPRTPFPQQTGERRSGPLLGRQADPVVVVTLWSTAGSLARQGNNVRRGRYAARPPQPVSGGPTSARAATRQAGWDRHRRLADRYGDVPFRVGDFNGYDEGDRDASVTYTLDFTGITPHPNQGLHVKLTINAEGSQGADVKHKVSGSPTAPPPRPRWSPPTTRPADPPRPEPGAWRGG